MSKYNVVDYIDLYFEEKYKKEDSEETEAA